MDVAAQGAANGHTVVLLHGNNFGGFYFKAVIEALTKAGFRVIVPDQIGYGQSSKPIAPYNFNSQARNTYLILQKEKIERVMVVGHSMGGMLAARLATQYPKAVERLVIYNPIGLTDGRFDRPMPPIDESYQQTLKSDYQSIRAGLGRYVAHNPKAWNAEFETYTRIRYSWTLSADWPRLAMVQALIGQMLYADPVVYDWAHIQVPTLAFGGAEDMLLGPAARFQERMQDLARTIPNGNGRVLLLPGLGHVPHLEAPETVLPPLVAFLSGRDHHKDGPYRSDGNANCEYLPRVDHPLNGNDPGRPASLQNLPSVRSTVDKHSAYPPTLPPPVFSRFLREARRA